jgi:hypothetical protein
MRIPILDGAADDERFLVKDDFLTPRAAGAVNGTPADGVGGLRSVVDTESKLSVGAGGLVFAGGKASPGYGDPGIWYPAQARVSGRALVLRATLGTGGKYVSFGWDTNQTQLPSEMGLIVGVGGTIYSCIAGSLGAGLGTCSAGQRYDVAMVLRASGMLIFIRGGTRYPNWTLLLTRGDLSTASLYPCVAGYDDNTTIRTLRIPERTIPITAFVLATDAFAGLVGSTDGAGIPEGGGGGLAWTNGAGMANSGGARVNTPTPGAEAVVNGGFDADISGWTTPAAQPLETLEWNGAGKLHAVNGAGGNGYLNSTAFSVSLGGWYRVQCARTLTSGANPQACVAKSDVGVLVSGDAYRATAATLAYVFRAGEASVAARFFCFVNGSATDYLLDDISIKPLSLTDCSAFVNVGTPEHLVEVDLTQPAGMVGGLWARVTNPADPTQGGIHVWEDGAGTVRVDLWAGGVCNPNAITGPVTYGAGKWLKAQPIGNELRVFYDNALVGSAIALAGVNLTGNYAGVFNTGADAAGVPVQIGTCNVWKANPESSLFEPFFRGTPA